MNLLNGKKFDSDYKSNKNKPLEDSALIRRINSQAVPLIFAVGIALLAGSAVFGQKTVDRTLAVVGDNSGRPELVTYSDVLWQIALEGSSSLAPPADEEVARALETVIRQRLFVLEANRLPQAPPTEAEIKSEIKDLLSQFPSTLEFEARLRSVGFESVKDPDFERLMTERVRIKKYIDFRFRSFVVVTPDDERKYFNEVLLPDFKRRFPGSPEPTFIERREQINKLLVERGVAQSIEAFIDEAERTAEIVYLTNN